MSTLGWVMVFIVAIGALGACLLVALGVLKTLPRAFDTVERMQNRHAEHMDKTLDRLMAIKWEDYVALRDMEQPEDGGFFSPEDQRKEAGIEVEEPGRWGDLRVSRDRLEAMANEEDLLREDFAEERT